MSYSKVITFLESNSAMRLQCFTEKVLKGSSRYIQITEKKYFFILEYFQVSQNVIIILMGASNTFFVTFGTEKSIYNLDVDKVQ